MKRRKFLATAGAIGVSGLSGCLFQNTLLSGRKITSEPATVPQFVFERTVFDKHSLDRITSTSEVEYRGEKSDIQYTEWSSKYFTSSESVETLWIRTYPERQIGQKVLRPRNLENIRDALKQTETPWSDWVVESESRDYDVSIIDKEVSVDEYIGAVSSPSIGTVNTRFFFCRIRNESDVLACFGAIPEESESYDDLLSMLQSIVHPSDSEKQEVVEPEVSTEENQSDNSTSS